MTTNDFKKKNHWENSCCFLVPGPDHVTTSILIALHFSPSQSARLLYTLTEVPARLNWPPAYTTPKDRGSEGEGEGRSRERSDQNVGKRHRINSQGHTIHVIIGERVNCSSEIVIAVVDIVYTLTNTFPVIIYIFGYAVHFGVANVVKGTACTIIVTIANNEDLVIFLTAHHTTANIPIISVLFTISIVWMDCVPFIGAPMYIIAPR